MASLVRPEGPGWSWDVAVLVFAGVAMTFGIWWIYFGIRFGDFLHQHRERGFGFGYGHYVVLVSLVAVGAGFHVAAYYFEGQPTLTVLATATTIAIPLAGFILSIYVLFAVLTRSFDPYHVGAIALTVAVIAAGVVPGWARRLTTGVAARAHRSPLGDRRGIRMARAPASDRAARRPIERAGYFAGSVLAYATPYAT